MEQEDNFQPGEKRRMNVEIAADRAAPILEETTVICHSKTFSPFDLAQITRKLRGMHVAFRDQTRLPFPLHETSKLADAIK